MKRLSSLVLLLVVLSSPALAQHPMDDRGFNSGRVYSFHGIDSVNQFNGNLNVRIPIGPAMRVSDRLSYQLAVHYNSHVWTYDTTFNGDPWGRQLRFNAGLGWQLSLGKLYFNGDPDQYVIYTNGWTYVSPDGGVHTFGSGDLTYSNDGTHIRLRKVSDTECHLDFPDGTVHVFYKLAPVVPPQTGAWLPSSAQSAGWYLSQIKEPTSTYITNTVHIEYSTTSAYKELWQITDSNDRQITVAFKNSPISNLGTELDYVDLPSYLDQVVRYSFTYADFNVPPPYGDRAYSQGAQIPTRVLTAVTPVTPAAPQTPIAAGYSMTVGGSPAYDTTREGSGALKRLVLPTLGSIGWEHFVRGFNDATNRAPVEVPVVVTKRYECDPATSGGTCAAGQSPTWTYGATFGGRPHCPILCPDGVTYPCYSGRARQLTTWLKEPAGASSEPRTTVNYFNIYQFLNDPDGDTCPANGFINGELGLPFTRYATDSDGRFLSTELRHGFRDADAGGSWNGEGAMPDVDDRIRERSYVKYEYELPSGVNPFGWNPRVHSASTQYPKDTGCDGICVRRTDHFNYTGYGQYRRTSSNDNFGGTGNFRTTFTNYQPSTGTSWILGLHSEQCVADETSHRSAEVSNCAGLQSPNVTRLDFHASTGLLLARRVLKGPGTALSRMDFLTVFGYDGNGTLTSEQSYGGDTNLLPVFQGSYLDAGVFTPSGGPQYQVTHTPTYAPYTSAITRLQSSYANGVSAGDTDFDQWTGVVKAARDVADQTTSYGYDILGRITSVAMPGASTMSYTYSDAVPGGSLTPAKVVARQQTSSEGEVAKEYHYDGLGRLWREKSKQPQTGSAWSMVQTTYDAAGHVAKASMPEIVTSESSFVPQNEIKYTQFDVTGAPTQIESPDAKTSWVVRIGAREVQRVSAISTPLNADTYVTTTERHDSRGRLIEVLDYSGSTTAAQPNGALSSTQYEYDSGDRLTRVLMNTTASPTQTRIFEYDNRGVLNSETHPELGVSGNGTISYPSYDARGHLRERLVGGTTLRFTYDDAERMTNVDRIAGGVTTPLKAFTFAPANDGIDLKKGKLETAIRYNNLPQAGTIEVKESYAYATPSGQMSKRTTLVERVAGGTRTLMQQFEYSTDYDELRLPRTITMPTCQYGCALGQALSNFTNTRTNGVVTRVDQIIGQTYYPLGSFTYQPSGMVATVTHPSVPPSTDHYGAAHGLPRPSNIRFDGGTSCPEISLPAINAASSVCSSSTGNGASVNPPAGVTLLWTISTGGTITTSATIPNIQFTAPPSGVVTLTVTATSACGATAQSSKTISVTSAPSATLSVVGPSTITRPDPARLRVTLTGSGPWTVNWEHGRQDNVSTSTFEFDVYPASTTTYRIVSIVEGSCTANVNIPTTITVLPPAPTGVTATMQANRLVDISWTPVSGATSYVVERTTRRGAAADVSIPVTGTTYQDTVPLVGLAVGYIYYVRAVDGTTSERGAFDYAVSSPTMYEGAQAVAPGTPILASFVNELRAAIDAFRYAFDVTPAFTGTTPVQPGHAIAAARFTELVNAFNDGRSLAQAGYLPFSYSITAPNTNVPIDHRYITELRNALR